MKKYFNNEKGFTFIEILLGLVIAILVGLALTSFTKVSFDSHFAAKESLEEIWESRYTMDQISDEIKYAISATPSADQKSLTYQYPNPSNPAATIEYRLYKGNDNLLYISSGSTIRPITKKPVTDLICEYNKDDTSNQTIDIKVTFDRTTLSTTVIPLNRKANN